jgi:hypothetical protein
MIGAIAVNASPECKSLRHGCAYRPPDANDLRDRHQRLTRMQKPAAWLRLPPSGFGKF